MLFTKYPISRGMVVYAILWPSSDLFRQAATNGIQKDKTYAAGFVVTIRVVPYKKKTEERSSITYTKSL